MFTFAFSSILLLASCSVALGRISFITIADETNHRNHRSLHKRDVSFEAETIQKPNVHSYFIQSDVKYRYAVTVISSRVVNPANIAQEVSFTVTLPESAFIAGFLMVVKNNTYKAYVKEKAEAKRVYNEAKNAGKTAAHVEMSARDSNIFTVSVNVEPLDKITFNLTYEEFLHRTLGVYENVINVNPGQIVKSLDVIVNIDESTEITTLEVSDLKTGNEITDTNNENKLAVVSRPKSNVANVIWSPSVDDQKAVSENGVQGQIIIRYDVNRSAESSQILVDEGYFVHFFAPSDLNTLPKYLIFVLDISGSMAGQKINQLKEAMNHMLDEVTTEDYLSIVLFSTRVQLWTLDGTIDDKELAASEKSDDISKFIVSATKENVRLAIEYIKRLYAQSSTNIIAGLRNGMKLAKFGKKLHSENEPIMFFLTDGEPNEEESNPKEITKQITNLNSDIKCPIFSLSLGDGADYKFLKSLSLSNFGFARKIYVASDTHLQLNNFYKQIASPLLSKVSFKYVPDQIDENSITKSDFGNYFLGSELVVAGKLTEGNQQKMIDVDLDANFKKCGTCRLPQPNKIVLQNENHSNVTGHLERLWAYMYIKQLLDKDLVNGTADPSYKTKALALSLQYSFVTPLTSLVVVKPNETESSDTKPADKADRPVKYNSFPRIGFGGGANGYLDLVDHFPSSDLIEVRSAAYIPQQDIFGIRGVPVMAEGWGSPVSLSVQRGASHTPFLSSNGGLSSKDSLIVRGYSDRIIGGQSTTIPPHTRKVPSSMSTSVPTTTGASAKKLTIDDISWLDKILGTVKLPDSDVDYMTESHNPNKAHQNCTSPKYGQGFCRYMKYCVLPEITKTIDEYLPYSCVIDNVYAGVCCPTTYEFN